jgi:hypothetical protein
MKSFVGFLKARGKLQSRTAGLPEGADTTFSMIEYMI